MGPDKVLIEQRHVTHEAGEPSLDPGLWILLEEGGRELLLVNLEVEHFHHVVAAHHDVGHARLLHEAEARPLLRPGRPRLVVRVDIVSDRLVHVFLPIMPILGYNSLEHLRAFGALEPLLVTVLVGREPLLAGELLPARGAMKLLHVDLGVGQIINNTFLLLSQVRDTREKLFHAFN